MTVVKNSIASSRVFLHKLRLLQDQTVAIDQEEGYVRSKTRLMAD
jgi:hypothetical protein